MSKLYTNNINVILATTTTNVEQKIKIDLNYRAFNLIEYDKD